MTDCNDYFDAKNTICVCMGKFRKENGYLMISACDFDMRRKKGS